jgi:hypothetical protein
MPLKVRLIKRLRQLSVEAHAIILETWEVKIRRTEVRGQPRPKQNKKFMRPHLKQWLGTVVHICHPGYTRRPK